MSTGRSLHGSGARKEERGRWLSSRGVRRSPWCGRGWTGATTALKGISGDDGLGEVVAVDSGVASARGSACSMEWTAAELLDTMRGRTGGGEHGYDEGTAMVASVMAGEREGEELERRGGVWGVRGSEGAREAGPRRHRARGAARRRAGAWRALRSPSGTCLPAWPASSSLERCWAGPAGGPGAGAR